MPSVVTIHRASSFGLIESPRSPGESSIASAAVTGSSGQAGGRRMCLLPGVGLLPPGGHSGKTSVAVAAELAHSPPSSSGLIGRSGNPGRSEIALSAVTGSSGQAGGRRRKRAPEWRGLFRS